MATFAEWFNQADFQLKLGSAHFQRGQFAEAGACFRRALAINPNDAEAFCSLGNVLVKREQLAEAADCFRQALRLSPENAAAHFNLGAALSDQGQFDQAIESFRQALRLNPRHVEAHNNLGNALQVLGQFAEAGACYEQALSIDPGYRLARLNRAHLRLLEGNFEEGWLDYEQRWAALGKVRPSFQQPCWNGSPLEGKTILVYAEQGLGDTLLFVRYLPLVKGRGGSVVFECQPALGKLLTGISGVDRLVVAGETLPPFDVQVPLLSLPHLFGTRMGTIPAQVPYLEIKEAQRAPRDEARRRLHIGIVWQGSMNQKADRRSLPLAHFESLARLVGIQLVSLQVGPGTKQLANVSFPITDLGSRFDPNSLGDLAAAMKHVDLVVTVDTAAAHLAGALGVPVWTLLSFGSDWRWLLDRMDSPWYPSMRLFRQRQFGDWDEVLERVAAEMRALIV